MTFSPSLSPAAVVVAFQVRDWVIIEILGWGIFSAGSMPVMDARWSDVFGRTPELSSRLQAKIWTIATACQVISPLIGAQIFLRNKLAGFWCSAAALALQSAIIFSSNETLAKADRKPFSLSASNPFSNIAILFTNGAGLRGLSLAAAFMESTKGTWSTQETYRFSALKCVMIIRPIKLSTVLRPSR